MIEALQKLMREIADMKTLPDADMPFLVQMENMILQRMKQPVDDLRAQGQLPPAAPQQAPMMAGSPMGGGMMAGPQMPPMDEMNRMLSAGAPQVGV